MFNKIVFTFLILFTSLSLPNTYYLDKDNPNASDSNVYKTFLSRILNHLRMSGLSVILLLIIVPNLYSQYYYVTPDANGSGDGTVENPWTIYQAAANVQAGDTIFVQIGTYSLNSVLSISHNGTYSKPIVFRGVRADVDEKIADGTNNTFLRQDNSTTGGQINISGEHIKFENMIIRQQYPKYLLIISGSNVTLDSVVTQYPSNVSSSSDHTILTTADSTTIRYCYFWQGPRTIVWVKPIYPNTCDHFLMEYTTITGFDNHYAVQLMPQTQSSPVPKVTNSEIRNCTFTDGGYESSLYIRNVYNCKIYNNLFINSLGRYADLQLYITDGVSVEDGYDAHSIFAFNTIYSTLVGGSGIKSASSILFMGESNQNGWTIKNNVCSVADGIMPYRYLCLSSTPSGQNFSIDYNLIYVWNKSLTSILSSWTQVNSCGISSFNWSDWQTQKGFDMHSVIDTDPDFINPTTDQNTWDFKMSNNRIGEDLSAWGITTDYDGNIRDPNNPTIGAFEYITGSVDTTSPRVTSASLINSTTVRVSFSEPIVLPAANNPSNYLIDNGVVVNSVSYSGNQATLTTTLHSTGNYTVTVNNVTDLAGNIISPDANTAQYEMLGDVTPPEVDGAQLIDSLSLKITFSESLDPTTAENINNYIINPSISVLTANLSGAVLTLSTSVHSVGTYTITVSNVTDLAGNLISPSANSANYEMVDDSLQGLIQFEIDSATASVIPEPEHSPNQTIDGLGYADGDPDSRWAGDTMPEWILFDLGMVKQISLVRLAFYSWETGRIYNYTLKASTDLNNWVDILTNVSSAEAEWTENQFSIVDARYIKVVFISSNQNGWAGLWEAQIWGYDDPLAVELTEFSGQSDGQNIVLNWKTSTELNNSGFQIERKISDNFISVGYVNGNGTSPEEHSYSFVDSALASGSYYYRLKMIEFGGAFEYSDEVLVDVVMPERFILEQNFPNPFNPSTTIRFSLPQRSEVKLTIYTLLGETVESLVEQELEAGVHSYDFSPTNLSSGVYLYALESKDFKEIKKLVLLK